MRVRTKICGVTSPQDAGAAAAAGCDAIGMVFHAGSARCVDAQRAAAVAQATPPFVARVGVFVDPTPAAVEAILRAVPLDLLQFHGDEPAALCEGFGLPYVKAVRVRPGFAFAPLEEAHPSARGFLLDAWHPSQAGGAGVMFDWSLWPQACARPLLLAGGLAPGNVANAIRRLGPYGVDVSSGVEDAVRGVKSARKMQAFVQEVQRAGIE